MNAAAIVATLSRLRAPGAEGGLQNAPPTP